MYPNYITSLHWLHHVYEYHFSTTSNGGKVDGVSLLMCCVWDVSVGVAWPESAQEETVDSPGLVVR